METLSELGRKEICKVLNIRDEKSIFIKNQEAFMDRANLFNVAYDLERFTKVYKEEMSTFATEEEYIKFLDEGRKWLKDDIKFLICKAAMCVQILGETDAQCAEFNGRTKLYRSSYVETEYILRFYFDSPLYEGLRYLCKGLVELPIDIKDYIKTVTKSNFLAEFKDLDPKMLSNTELKILNEAQLNLGYSIFGSTCPKFLNSKDLLYIGKSEVKFSSSKNKAAVSLSKMVDNLRMIGILPLENINIELYSTSSLARDSKLKIKDVLLYNKRDNPYDLVDNDEVSTIAYLRHIRKEPMSKYDKYFQYKGIESKLSRNIKIDWIG